jgi:hypothetical protein
MRTEEGKKEREAFPLRYNHLASFDMCLKWHRILNGEEGHKIAKSEISPSFHLHLLTLSTLDQV